ncbi:MAG: nicotinamide-nucleotide amidohydrolase family protein [Provencibacterium sp.]|nr:nicotinamide-nucleotide amidohydrolase family protein [Provencibacterium sp.]
MIAEIITTGPAFTDAARAYSQPLFNDLALLGIELRYQVQAAGPRARLQQAMAQALQRSDCILVFGGVGLQAGDITKDVICEGLSIPCAVHTESYSRLCAYYEAAGLPVPPTAQRACMLPRAGTVFPGEGGGAPGCAIAAGDQCILMLPASLEEGLPMFMNRAYSFLAAFTGATVASRAARVFGLDEDQSLSYLSDLMASRNPVLSIYTQQSEVIVRVTARAGTRAQASNMCTPYLKEIVGRLGEAVYGIDVDSLEAVAVTHMGQKRLRLASAESGTGGLLARRLNAVPGAQSVYPFGLAAHADRVKVQSLGVPEKLLKKFGAVSDRVAVQMAFGAMDAGKADIGLAITGVSGGSTADGQPNGLFYVAACDKNQAVIRRLALPSEWDANVLRETAVSHALNLVRLILDYDPEPCPGSVPLAAALKGKAELCPPADTLPGALEDLEDGKPSKRRRKARAAESYDGAPQGRSGWEKARIVLLCLLILVFLGSAGYLGLYYWKSHQSRTLYDSLSSIAEEAFSSEENVDASDLPDGYPDGYLARFATLWEQNPDIRGWLKIEGSGVSYPVLQAKDNDYYLRRDFERKSNDHGVPFLDYEADLERPSENLIIYGHNMKDGQIFGELMNYKDPAYLKEHPVIEFDSVYREGKYKVIGVFLASTEKDHGPIFEYEKFVNGSEEVTASFLDQVELRTMVHTGVDVTPQDELLCLSTCSYEYWEARFVVVARRIRDGESEKVDTSKIERNANPLMPDVYYEIVKEKKPSEYADLGAWAPKDVAPAQTQPVGPIGPGVGKPSQSGEAGEPSQEEPEESVSSDAAGVSHVSTAPSSSVPASSVPVSSAAPSSSAPASSTAQPSSSAPAVSSVSAAPSSSAVSSSRSSSVSESSRSSSSQSPSSSSSRVPTSSGKSPWDLKPGETINIFGGSRPPSYSNEDDEDEIADPDGDYESSEDPDGDAWWAGNDLGSSSKTSSSKSSSSEKPWWADNDLGSSQSSAPWWADNSGVSSTGSAADIDPDEKITVDANGKSYTGKFQEIVARMVQAEMGSSFHKEALKAQAVASATYLQYYLSRGQTPSIVLATGSVSSKVQEAVDAVSGERVLYNGKPINATYFASAAGCTNNSEDVWDSKLSYLRSVDSPEEEDVQKFTVSYKEMRNLIEDEVNIDRDLLEETDPEDWLDITYCDNGAYVKSVKFCGKKSKSGTWVRYNLLTKLYSHGFMIRYDDDEEEFAVTCYGRGHGVGLSQMGAQYLAVEEDYSYKKILKFYYSGVSVE